MIMTPRLRKFALTAHVTSSVGWLGTVAAFQALAIAAVRSRGARGSTRVLFGHGNDRLVRHRAFLRCFTHDQAYHVAGHQSPVLHSGGGLLVLLVTTILAVYKPWGLTRYGRRKQQTGVEPGSGSETTASKQYLLLGIIVLILLSLILHLISGGPRGH